MTDRDEILDAEDEAYKHGLKDGKKRGALHMRERAAKLAYDRNDGHMAAAIRDLPTDTGGADK